MRKHTNLTFSMLGLGCVLLVALWTLDGSRNALDAGSGERARAAACAPGQTEAGAAETPDPRAAERSPLAAAAPDTGASASGAFGALLVHVVWGRDKTPAPEILVTVHAPVPLEATSDARGVARFPRVAAGDVTVSLDRAGEGRAKVVAGAEAETTVEIAPGVDAAGGVVDAAGVPVPAAELWLSDSCGMGRLAGRADRDGRFLVRAVAPGQNLGARAPGHAPSETQQPQAGDGGRVEMRLVLPGRGAELEGVVLDASGRPVADALVAAGAPRSRTIAGLSESAIVTVRSDAAGRFQFAGLAPGTANVVARAEGFAIWRGSVATFADEKSRVEVRLGLGATLLGSVATSQHAPVAAAAITVGDDALAFTLRTTTAADGTFRLEHVGTGDASVTIRARLLGCAVQRVVTAEGQEARLDFVFPPPLAVAGQVLDDAGRPLAGWRLELIDRLEDGFPADPDHAEGTTDARGKFRLEPVHERPHHLRLFAPEAATPSLSLDRAAPSQGELLLRVTGDHFPSVWIAGALLDAAGKPIAGALLVPLSSAGLSSGMHETDAETGRFELGPFPAGEWTLHVIAPGYPNLRLGPQRLGSDATWDLGTLCLGRPGTLAVAIERSPGVPAGAEVRARIVQNGREARAEVVTAGDALTSSPLLPGEYALRVEGPALASQLVPFTIRADERTRLSVVVHEGTARTLRVVEAEPDADQGEIAVTVRTAGGKSVYEGTLWRRTNPGLELTLALTPGSYSVLATTSSGKRAEGGLEVGEARVGEPLELVLR